MNDNTPRAATPEEIAQRLDPLRKEWGAQLVDLAALLDLFGDAMQGDDRIIGALAAEGLTTALSALPSHIRHLFMEYLSDEAAAGLAADRRFIEAMGG